jgi:hypothetical protein
VSDSLPSRVRRHFEPVSTELHTAPAARSFFARIQEMQHTLAALSNSRSVGSGKKLSGTLG